MKYLASILIAFTLIPVALHAQEDLSAKELHLLVEEVRGLRTTLQHLSASQLRGQLLIQRLTLQNQVVRELGNQVESSGNENRMMESEPFQTTANDLEERLRKETNPDTRRQLNRELEGLNKRKEMQARHREQWRIRMQRVEARYNEERDRMRGIEDELNRLLAQLAGTPDGSTAKSVSTQ